MKKLLVILAAIVLTVGTAAARDKVYRSADILPEKAQKDLKANFPKQTVNLVKVDSKLIGGKEYEVILDNGSEIEYNKDGDWTSVDCGHRAVPGSYILKEISTYVAKNYKGMKIVKIDKDSNDYEVELSNGLELKFDRSGKFLRLD